MDQQSHLSRREFVAAASAGLMLGPPVLGNAAKLPQRPLGKTGVQVPILGLGTVAVGNKSEMKEAVELIHKAIDLGITYIDTAPPRTRIAFITGYSRAQQYLKGVLKERRKEIFIATKCLETDGSKTIELLKKNLDELGIEQTDLAYTHAIGHAVYDFAAMTADDGPMAMLEKAKKDGLCRFVGITGHNRPEKFAQVIEKRQIDAMMNACNIVDRHTYAFEDVVWPAARKKGVGLVAMKVMGGGIVGCKMPEELRHASFRWVLSQPEVATAVIGMGSLKELEQNAEWAKNWKPMPKEEAEELKKKTVPLAKDWGAHLDRLDAKGEKNRPLVNT